MTDENKRILFTLPTLMPGGAERVVITLMNNLDRARFEPHFLSVSEEGTLRSLIAPDTGFHSFKSMKVRFALPRLIKTLNKIQPDIIVSTLAGMNMAVLLAKPFLKKKPRIVIREAVVPSSIINKQFSPALARAAYKFLYPRADVIIAPAQIIIDEYENILNLDTNKCVLLRNPVDAEKILAHPFNVHISEGRKKTTHFVAAGRLHRQKGFDRLIEALPRLDLPDWKLLILGAGPEEENLKTLITAKRLERHVSLTGLHHAPWPIYGAADAFLLPSRWEGLPNVALESLAAGTPVIAMKEAGGIGEIAALAAPGAVTIAASMDEFIDAMKNVRPAPAESYRPSLLPGEFALDNVMKKFSSFLSESEGPSSP